MLGDYARDFPEGFLTDTEIDSLREEDSEEDNEEDNEDNQEDNEEDCEENNEKRGSASVVCGLLYESPNFSDIFFKRPCMGATQSEQTRICTLQWDSI